MTPALNLARVRAGLGSQLAGSTLLWYPTLDSTQAELRRQVAAGAPLGTVVGTETQTAGQGRRGRRWQDRPGQDLLFSIFLPQPRMSPGLLPVALGAGLAEALAELTGVEIQFQWPNDLVLEQAKLGGMLVEQVRGQFLLGLGVNVLGGEPLAALAARERITLEAAARQPLVREPVLVTCLKAIEAVCHEESAERLSRVIAERDALRGQRVAVERPGTREALRGIGAGIAPEGTLLVAISQGVAPAPEMVEVRVADAVKVEAEV
ncbi:MAG: biotin--[acetyl-CoA-carboxylase] ligase [candidate division WS1 bacterium]|nr:biotin--[acetyl-CoA-carboxylase] ligase [candidate division WS1 bacterium]